MKRSRSDVKKDSANAVANAGGRMRNKPSGSAGSWRPERGLRKEGPWRPGKTKRKRGR